MARRTWHAHGERSKKWQSLPACPAACQSRKSFTASMIASHLGRGRGTCVLPCVCVCVFPHPAANSFHVQICAAYVQTVKPGKQAKLCKKQVSTFQFPTFLCCQYVPTASSSSFVRWMSWIVKGVGNCNGDEKTACPVSVGMPRPLASGCFRPMALC